MITLVISLPHEYPKKHLATVEYLNSIGLQHEVINGIHGEQFGLKCDHPYNYDRSKWEEGNFFIGYKYTGVFLSHYMTWVACSVLDDDYFMICEGDVKFEDNWQQRISQAIKDAPNFDFIFLGSCCAKDKSPKHIAGEVHEAKYPQCLHCYIVAKKAIPHLLKTNRDCYAPIDISLILHSFPMLNVYTVLPRVASQLNTVIPE